MFPILSLQQKWIGFGGRSYNGEMPKYINSPDSEIFHKGQIFYGMDRGAKHIRTEGYALIVEGYMDAIALVRRGILPVVATLGTALTERHAKILSRITQKVVVLFDSDEAGLKAAIKSLPLLLSEGLYPYHVYLDENLDPDEFLNQKGIEEFRKKIKNSQELYLFVLDQLFKNYRGGFAEKVEIQQKVLPLLQVMKNTSLKTLYSQELADRLGVRLSWIYQGIPSSSDRGTKYSQHSSDVKIQKSHELLSDGLALPSRGIEFVDSKNEENRIDLQSLSKIELYVLNLVIKFEKVIKEVQLKWNDWKDLFQSPFQQMYDVIGVFLEDETNEYRFIYRYLLERVKDSKEISLHLTRPFIDMEEEAALSLLRDCIEKLESKSLKKKTLQIKKDLVGSSTEDQLKKLEQIVKMKKLVLKI